jgi:hypothetical protein
MHPTLADITSLSDPQIEQKIQKLNSVYFITENEDVRHQIILLLDTYRLELDERRVRARLKQQQNGNNGLDNLIKIS